ncbi:hypothetical protein EDF46_0773 [Frondihabitans sp. PhB188]|uniref:hypothetical protein n=1 Tax=Frondihabitans sp. PhB188 TaxID=2485200 RepID=UPI000F478D17|nr:hypothetical protein [Frondihabitans sp. PhB188]ROQ41395.1 hypothetical protein EDF46_0773 [Frondihabitans sp. PhB188]
MPRSNRPRRAPGGRPGQVPAHDDGGDLSRILYGGQRTETRRGREWVVQAISGASSTKPYVCPGCTLPVEPGTPHVVAWRADGLFGEDSDLAARRHWHTHCWKIS